MNFPFCKHGLLLLWRGLLTVPPFRPQVSSSKRPDCQGPPADITMDADKTVTAVFVELFTLDISVTGSGTVTANPSQDFYEPGATVTLTPTPATHWRFDRWELDLSGSANPATITMNSDKSVRAVFIEQFKLGMFIWGGSGTTTPSGETWHDAGSVVDVTATPNSGYRFDHWTGADNSSANPSTVTMTSSKWIFATFVEVVEVTTIASPPEGGTVDPGGTNTYDEHTTVTFTATPNAGWRFDHWGSSPGRVTGSANPQSADIGSSDLTVTAYFVPQFTLTTQVSPSQGGSVSPAGTTVHDGGSTVSVNPNANPGWRFDHWEGDLSGNDDPADLTMNSNKTVTAVFIEQFTLTLIDSPEEGGSTSPENGPFDAGTEVTITATPGTDYGFGYWDGDFSGTTPSATITMDANKTITAHFIRDVLIEADLLDLVPEGGNFASGINTATIQMTVNGSPVAPTVTSITDGVHISFSLPGEEKQTSNTYTIQVMDNVGYLQTYEGGF